MRSAGTTRRRQLTIWRQPMGERFGGGMGGGLVVDGLWPHEHLDAPDLRAQVEAVLAGKRDRIALEDDGRLLFSGHVTDAWAFTVPDEPVPVSDDAADLIEEVVDALQEHQPAGLDRKASTRCSPAVSRGGR